jgi:hypothetical protein
MITKFHRISITGRYIYGYLCLKQFILFEKLTPTPSALDGILCEFVRSNRLDVWHSKAEEVLPSNVLKEDSAINNLMTDSDFEPIKEYYKCQPEDIITIYDELIWLGISNLYGRFDTDNSIRYLESIINILIEKKVELPPFFKVEKCSVTERKGWGELTDMSLYR